MYFNNTSKSQNEKHLLKSTYYTVVVPRYGCHIMLAGCTHDSVHVCPWYPSPPLHVCVSNHPAEGSDKVSAHKRSRGTRVPADDITSDKEQKVVSLANFSSP